MKRTPSKKAIERRKRPRSAQKRAKTAEAPTAVQATRKALQKAKAMEALQPGPGTAAQSAGTQIMVEAGETCQNCAKALMNDDRALFVEEEIGRVFCSETCITGFFGPEIERLEKEYHRRVSSGDLSKEERESYSHLRWITLQEPDEIWREKTLTGDQRYTLISEFQPGSKRIWCICICLFLKNEPSFLYLAFTTRNTAMANAYRRGERVEWAKTKAEKKRANVGSGHTDDIEASEEVAEASANAVNEMRSDRLADEWTEDETFLAEVNQERRGDDIPVEEFAQYERCLEESLETPDEVWSCKPGKTAAKLYHFIRHYRPEADEDQTQGYWYVIVARETDDDEQIEILDAFPTRDGALVDRYRRGEQEVGHTAPGPSSRVVH